MFLYFFIFFSLNLSAKESDSFDKISKNLKNKINKIDQSDYEDVYFDVAVKVKDVKLFLDLIEKKRVRYTSSKLVKLIFTDLNINEIFRFIRNDNVVLIEENYKVKKALVFSTKQIGVRSIWQSGYTGDSIGSDTIRVAVIDTGLDIDHSDFDSRTYASVNCYNVSNCANLSSNQDIDKHGTHVAGIILGDGSAFDSVNDKYYLEFSDVFYADSVNHVSFPVQVNNTSQTSSLSIKTTWEGVAGTSSNIALSEGYVNSTSSTFFTDTANITSTGPGVSAGKFYEVAGGVSGLSHEFLLSTYSFLAEPVSSSLNGNAFWTQIGVEAKGWGDAFSPTSGVAPDSEVIGVKSLGDTGSGTIEDIIRGLDYVYSKASTYNIIAANMSLTLSSGMMSEILNEAINELTETGVVVVVAAGNSQGSFNIASPGLAEKAITVGAVNTKNEFTYYSSVGKRNQSVTKPDVLAPGGSNKDYAPGIISSRSTYGSAWNSSNGSFKDPYRVLYGTSQAAPHVTGLISLMASKINLSSWQYGSSSLPKLIKMIICLSSFEISDIETDAEESLEPFKRAYAVKDHIQGYGRISPRGAMSALDSAWNISSSTPNFTFGDKVYEQKTYVRKISLNKNKSYDFSMSVPSGADFDLYLFDSTPDENGEPTLLAASAMTNNDEEEITDFIPSSTKDYYIAAKWVSGSGTTNISGSLEDKPSSVTSLDEIYYFKDLQNLKASINVNFNKKVRLLVNYGKTSGLESEKTVSTYLKNHNVNFDIEKGENYFFRIVGYPEDGTNVVTSAVYRIDATGNLYKSISISDLPITDSGGCGTIYDNSKNKDYKNLLNILVPFMFFFLLKIYLVRKRLISGK